MAKFELKRSLRVLRRFVLKLWKRLLSKDFASWFKKKGKYHEERDKIAMAGKEAMDRALKASW